MSEDGAHELVRALVDSGISVCFANPGTSELGLVAALEADPGMRTILCPHETVASGAADGYARLARRPAAVALHQGPGLANGLANLHNARKAGSPVLTLVGTSAEPELEGPLDCAPDALAGAVSKQVSEVRGDATWAAQDAVAAAVASPAGVSTLLVPETVSWRQGTTADSPRVAVPSPRTATTVTPPSPLDEARAALARGERTALVVGTSLITEEALGALAALSESFATRVLRSAFPTLLARGAGVPRTEVMAADAAGVRAQLAGVETVVLLDAPPPVAAFGLPGDTRRLLPDAVPTVSLLSGPDGVTGLLAELGVTTSDPVPVTAEPDTGDRPAGESLTAARVGAALSAHLPRGSVLVDESNSSSPALLSATENAAPHVLLTVPGFAVGGGLPLAVGAAVAEPDRRVVALVADGSAMFSLPALWTQAREQLTCLTVVVNNRGYQILRQQVRRRYAEGSSSRQRLDGSQLFSLSAPEVDFSMVAAGLGVPGGRATTVADLEVELARGLSTPGPYLVDAVVDAVDAAADHPEATHDS